MQALYAQLLVGLINGSFYALLSLGLAVIFGMLNIINFAHGALYMMGAFVAYFLLNGIDVPTLASFFNGSWLTLLNGLPLPWGTLKLPPLETVHIGIGLSYWWALVLAPITVGLFGMLLERTMLQWLTGLDHLYGLLLTFGLALIIQGLFQNSFGSSGLPYAIPQILTGGVNLGFMYLPI